MPSPKVEYTSGVLTVEATSAMNPPPIHRTSSEEKSTTFPISTVTEASISTNISTLVPSRVTNSHQNTEARKSRRANSLKMAQLLDSKSAALIDRIQSAKGDSTGPILINKNPYCGIKSPRKILTEDSSSASTSEFEDFEEQTGPNSRDISENEGNVSRLNTGKSTLDMSIGDSGSVYRPWHSPLNRLLIDQTPKTPIHTTEGAPSTASGLKPKFAKPPKVYCLDALGFDEIAKENEALNDYLFCDIPGIVRARKSLTEMYREDPKTGKLIRIPRVNNGRKKLPKNYVRTMRFLNSHATTQSLWGSPLLASGAGLRSEVSHQIMLYPAELRTHLIETKDFGIQYPPVRPKQFKDMISMKHESVYGGIPIRQVRNFCPQFASGSNATLDSSSVRWKPSFITPGQSQSSRNLPMRVIAMSKHHIVTADKDNCECRMQPLIYSSKAKPPKDQPTLKHQVIQTDESFVATSASTATKENESSGVNSKNGPVKITSEYELKLLLARLASKGKLADKDENGIAIDDKFAHIV